MVLTSGDVGLTVRPTASFTAAGGTLTVTPDADGSARLHIHLPATTSSPDASPPPAVAATVTLPEGMALDLMPDRSFLMLGSDGAPVAGVTPTRAARPTMDDGTLTIAAADGAELWLSDTAVIDLDWGIREGGRSLAVTPSAWGRSGSMAASALVWAAVSADPEADTSSMRAQLDCHILGAPNKATWNLEPWRPDVDALTMLSSRCNPA